MVIDIPDMHGHGRPPPLRDQIRELARGDGPVRRRLYMPHHRVRDLFEQLREAGAGERVRERHDDVGRAAGGAPGHCVVALVGAEGEAGGAGEFAARGVRFGGLCWRGGRTFRRGFWGHWRSRERGGLGMKGMGGRTRG